MPLRVPPASTAAFPTSSSAGSAPDDTASPQTASDPSAVNSAALAALGATFVALSHDNGVLGSSFDLGRLDDLVRKIVGTVGPQHPRSPAVDAWKQQTADFRNQLSSIRDLQAQIAQLDPSDPALPGLKAELSKKSGQLEQDYGYTADTAPAPNTLFIDPYLEAKEIPDGKLDASQFPTGKPVTQPADPYAVLFAQGTPLTLKQVDGTTQTVDTPEEYRAVVAKNRAEAGIPEDGGTPIAVNCSFQGGGGRGKRYLPAMETMLSLGVVPASLTGSSAGAIAAALLAGGANPQQLEDFLNAPALKKYIDLDLSHGDVGGVAAGQVAFDDLDQTLRQLTGIKDRPVTFADLKIPLQIIATKALDTAPPKGQTDLSQVKNREFVFSQETTPNTPVALAVRASMSIAALFRPVEMMDPVTGRQVDLVDGGIIDNLPMGFNPSKNDLPNIGLGLLQPQEMNPERGQAKQHPLPKGDLDFTHVAWSGLNTGSIYFNGAQTARQYRTLANPEANQFMIGLPTFNLDHPLQQDTILQFPNKPRIDDPMNPQTAAVVTSFLKTNWSKLKDPHQRATNVPKLPLQTKPFSVTGIHALGLNFTAQYTEGDTVHYSAGPVHFDVKIGQEDLRAIALDNAAFGNLVPELQLALELHLVSLGLINKIPWQG